MCLNYVENVGTNYRSYLNVFFIKVSTQNSDTSPMRQLCEIEYFHFLWS